MSFMQKIKETLNKEFNFSITENGAIGYRTTGKELVDLNFLISSLRGQREENTAFMFAKAFYADTLNAIKWLFYAGDVRGGVGERRLFRICLSFLAECEPQFAKRLLPFVAEYTRWDNLWHLLDTQLRGDVVALVKAQLDSDLRGYEQNQPISLLAKWLPSVNATSASTVRYGKLLAKELGLTQGKYRKTLAALRKHLKVIEVIMSRGDWQSINYEAVPSRANLIYNNAFLRNDEARRRDYLESLKKGEAKINSSVLFPHDIVHQYSSKKPDTALEEMWKSLPDYVKGEGNTLCVCDGSYSMECQVDRTHLTCKEVAIALTIYFAERSSGDFKDNFITFSDTPRLVDLSHCKSLRNKITTVKLHNECASTNIEAVFDLVLTTAVKNNMSQRDLPKNILILSDMEFNMATSSNSYGDPRTNKHTFSRLFDDLVQRYESHGYKMPRLIFWNIYSRSGTIPLTENELGVALVSGFSPAVVKMVLSTELDPYKILLQAINAERYQPIEDAIKDLV
ncbi:MAG: DUF2828 family protein [Clostridia bacterium]|nr:DUF2828 family protein [Clostridia bacterium]